MLKHLKRLSLWLSLGLCLVPLASYAGSDDNNGFGQSIQIYTRFSSFVGKPTWLLIIRDLDHGENIPYLFDVRRGNNFWIAFTRGRNYVITASRLQIETYEARCNTNRSIRINNFCHLESNGHIMRGKSMHITINGDLSPNSDDYTCHISTFSDANFTVAEPTDEAS